MNVSYSYQNKAFCICLVSQNSASGLLTLSEDCLLPQYSGGRGAFIILHTQLYSFKKRKERTEGTCTHMRERKKKRETGRQRRIWKKTLPHPHSHNKGCIMEDFKNNFAICFQFLKILL